MKEDTGWCDRNADTVSQDDLFLFQTLELFPIPIEVFRSDGWSVFVNSAFRDCFCVRDASKIVGRFNALQDRYLSGQPELYDSIRRMFAGETLTISDVRVPFAEIQALYAIDNERTVEEDVYQSITGFPIQGKEGNIRYIVTVFLTRQVYGEQEGIQNAKEYIETNWLEGFDLERISQATGFSRHHLILLFKKYTGASPYGYYQHVRLEKLKAALRDPRLTVAQAFSSCGMDYSGSSTKLFKKRCGMTPSQHKKTAGRADAGEGNLLHTEAAAGSWVEESLERFFRVLEWFPFPINVFDRSGTVVFVNPPVLELWNISQPAEIVGKYNLLRDPVVNSRLGLQDYVRRSFAGEVVLVPEVKTPLEDFSLWYEGRSPDFDIESVYCEILNFPLRDEGAELRHVVSIFLTTRVYQGRADIARAREFIENNWRERLDIDKIAKAAGLSRYHFVRRFKQHTGSTPYSYYQDIKVAKLKEALRDKNRTVAEAFACCGMDYRGSCAALFRRKVGMTPSEYRKSILKSNDLSHPKETAEE